MGQPPLHAKRTGQCRHTAGNASRLSRPKRSCAGESTSSIRDRGPKVAEQVRWRHIVIASIDVAVVLKGQPAPARLIKDAQPRTDTGPDAQRRLEDLHRNPPDIAAHPLVKDSDQERAIGLAVDAGWAGERRRGCRLDNGNKLDELRPDLVAQKTVDGERMFGIGAVDAGENVAGDLCLFSTSMPGARGRMWACRLCHGGRRRASAPARRG